MKKDLKLKKKNRKEKKMSRDNRRREIVRIKE